MRYRGLASRLSTLFLVTAAATGAAGAATTINAFGVYDFRSTPTGQLGSTTFNFRALADVNGDGSADYCRFINSPASFSCALAQSNNTFLDGTYFSTSLIGQGSAIFQALVDVTADKRADYCRFVGSSLSCAVATGNTFLDGIFQSVVPQGVSGTFQAMADVNGDGRADYCRFVGSPASFSCALAQTNNTFLDGTFSSASGIDPGGYFQALVDVNGDLRADYCRFVGAYPSTITLSCSLAAADGFGNDLMNSSTPYDLGGGASSFRGMADVNGDGRADYARYIANTNTLSAGLARWQIRVVDLIASSQSGETNQDSEPFLAIDPSDPSGQRMAASAFTPNPDGPTATTAPIFVTADGGATWSLLSIVPSQASTSDITLAYGPTGVLYAADIPKPSALFPTNKLRELPTFPRRC